MANRVTKFGAAVLLSVMLCGSARAQSLMSPPGTAQIQNLQRTAMKIGIASAAIGVGVTVITLVVRHHHHADRASKANDYNYFAAQNARARRGAEVGSLNAWGGGAAAGPLAPASEIKSASQLGNLSLQAQTAYGNPPAAPESLR